MADILNLRRARKAHERARRLVAAAESRLRHGRPPSEQRLEEAQAQLAETRLDAHLVARAPDGDG